jgi:BirA family biotin operon repressor/biotin-[acetyl-CoA-carboxylase] ligase
MDKLEPDLIKHGLRTSYIGQKIFYYTSTESTNTIAVELSKNGEAEGSVVIAEEQTKGKGRLGRQWLSTANKNILMSIIFRPSIDTSQLFFITMISSIALVRAIKKTAKIKAGIKWPNDIYIGNKKMAGILTEMDAGGGRINYAAVGIGLNVNFDPSDYPEIYEIATSLSEEAGKEISRIILLRTILEEIEKWNNLLKKGKYNRIYSQWKKHSIISGKRVKVISSGIVVEGIAESVDPDGSLILVDKDGSRKKILSGDVSLRLND